MNTTVVIPSYHRPTSLVQCVESILAGTQHPTEILIVGREGDKATEDAISGISARFNGSTTIRAAWVTSPGHVPPVEMGARTASGDLVAVVDDDITVTPNWLAFMAAHFSDPGVGVVGGRVLVPGAASLKAKGKPGRISWYGRQWGNLSSIDDVDSLEVDSVMEGNCIWRRNLFASLRFDSVLNFDDAVLYGFDLCLQAKARGYQLVYDSRALVYHHASPRIPALDRHDWGPRIFCYCRNYTYIAFKHYSWWRLAVFLCWWFLIGERNAWGIAALLFDILINGIRKKRYLAETLRGKKEGLRLGVHALRNAGPLKHGDALEPK